MCFRGQQTDFSNVNWPKTELIVNFVCLVCVLIAGIIESTNMWRWDYSRGSPLNYNGGIQNNGRYGAYGRRYGGMYGMMGGYNRGMGLTQGLQFNSYCMQYPRECQAYMSMLAGYNTYFGKCTAIFTVTFET